MEDNASKRIKKLRYVTDTCLPEPADGIRKQVYEVFPDGVVRYYIYHDYGKKADIKEKFHVPFKDVKFLLSDIEYSLRPENFQNPNEFRVYDNRGYTITLTFTDGNKVSVDGTFGGGPIDTRMQMFIDMLAERKADTSRRDYRICPYCGSDRVIPIVYGYPDMELIEEYEKGNVQLGGCIVNLDGTDETAYCKDCDTSWSDDMLTVDHMKKVKFAIDSCGLETRDMHTKDVYEVYSGGTVKYSLYRGYSNKPSCSFRYNIEPMKVTNLFADLRKYSRSDYKDLLRESYACDGSINKIYISFVDGTVLTYKGYCCEDTFGERMVKFLKDNKISDFEDD